MTKEELQSEIDALRAYIKQHKPMLDKLERLDYLDMYRKAMDLRHAARRAENTHTDIAKFSHKITVLESQAKLLEFIKGF